MKKTLSLVFLVMISLISVAQYVPAKYKFSTLPVGAYAFDACFNTSANPSAGLQAAIDASDGYSGFSGGQMGTAQTTNIAAFNSAWSICDMRSVGAGKVLIAKGKNSTVSEGTAATALIPGWLSLHLYGNNNFPINQRMRMSFTFAMKVNTPAVDALLGIGITSLQVGDVTTGKLAETLSLNSLDYNDLWVTATTDVLVTETSGVPVRVKIKIAGNKIDNAALYFKDFSFTPVYDGTTQDSWVISTTPMSHLSTGIERQVKSVMKTSVQNGVVYVSGIEDGKKVSVYNTTGLLVDSRVSDSGIVSFSLSKGLYIIKSEGNSTKIML